MPVANLTIERLPRLEAEAKAKLKRDCQNNLRFGLDARYDVFGGNTNKIKLLESPAYTSAARLSTLFERLEAAQVRAVAAESDAPESD